MKRNVRIPVIIALGDFASGVTSWAFRLREAFQDHPRYTILLMNCHLTGNNIGRFDLVAPSREGVRAVLRELAPAVVVPNFIWDVFTECAGLVRSGRELRCIGFCRADSQEEYYDPLLWYEPMAAKFVAVSPECGVRLAELLPGRQNDVAVLPTGVWVPRELRRTWQSHPIRLVYGGRIVQEQKRVMDFVPLVAHLLELGCDFAFDIIGAGRQLPELRQAMDQLPHAGRVRFLDRVPPDRMPEIWGGHDVFLQTSSFEGTSNSMLECMALGTVPLVTETLSGIAGVLTHGQNGLLVPIGDMRAMALEIDSLAREPARLEALGRAARETAEAYSMDRYVARFAAILDAAVAEPVRKWPDARPLEPAHSFPGIALRPHEAVEKSGMPGSVVARWLGRELLKNGAFTAWHGEHLDDWTGPADRLESGSGARGVLLKPVSGGSAAYLEQTLEVRPDTRDELLRVQVRAQCATKNALRVLVSLEGPGAEPRAASHPGDGVLRTLTHEIALPRVKGTVNVRLRIELSSRAPDGALLVWASAQLVHQWRAPWRPALRRRLRAWIDRLKRRAGGP